MRRVCFLFLTLVGAAYAAELEPITTALADSSSLRIETHSAAPLPWTVAGENGALFGRQDGIFEAWVWPVKLFSHFRIAAELAGYPVPIDVNALSARIRVTPAETAITYAHAAFTVTQHSFAPRGHAPSQTGAVVYFEIHSTRPLTLTFSFTPDMLRMWPAPNFGRPDGEWVPNGNSGLYILHTDNPTFSGFVAMPSTKPGILPPYQERPQVYPLQLRLHFDPKQDDKKLYPLIFGVARGTETPQDEIAALAARIPNLYQATQNYYAEFFKTRTAIETPDPQLNDAARWAEVSVDQMQVRTEKEIGMVGGYYESAASARPGYAWFFGRDTLWTTFAINSYGDFALTKTAIEFLLQRQRADGKIMHEFSQAANSIDWKTTPYFYAAADSVPLLVMAMWDYVRASGDVQFLREHWPAIQKAYQFERAHDSDGDGIYENTEGTGWVESWPPGMPHQEIYLAALDQQSSYAMSKLAALMNDTSLTAKAAATAQHIAGAIAKEYWLNEQSRYAFSRNADGTLDDTSSIYPAVAWWQNSFELPKAGKMLSAWASDEISTDWGARDIAGSSQYFDPISYHQGSVWPLFTGWVALAEYRAGHTVSGYAHLLQNARLTWLQDLGSATELLSGAYYTPLGRSSSHQMWSSAMILSPLLKGLFGLEPNALRQELRVQPHLPAQWDHAHVRNVHVGSQLADVSFERKGARLEVTATTPAPATLCLSSAETSGTCHAAPAASRRLELALPPIEIGVTDDQPQEGEATHAMKVLDEHYEAHQAMFTLSAPGGSTHVLFVRDNTGVARADGAVLNGHSLTVHFPPGAGYQQQTVRFSW